MAFATPGPIVRPIHDPNPRGAAVELAGAEGGTDECPDNPLHAKVMAAMDEANRRWGRATVVPAAMGIAAKNTFTTKFEMRSPRFTTRWDELPKCR